MRRLLQGLTSCRESVKRRKEEVRRLKMSYTAYRKSMQGRRRGGVVGGVGDSSTTSMLSFGDSTSTSDPFMTPSQTPMKGHGQDGEKSNNSLLQHQPMVPLRSGAGSFGSSTKKEKKISGGTRRLGGSSSSSSSAPRFPSSRRKKLKF